MKILILLFSLNAFADDSMISDYIKSKSFRCHLTQDQLALQLVTQLDQAVSQVRQSLKSRGIEAIDENRAGVRFGTYPGAAIYDFDVMEPIAVGDGGFLQTTRYSDASDLPIIEPGLWIPFTVVDGGPETECKLQKILAHVGSRDVKYLPSVDVVGLTLPSMSHGSLFEPLDLQIEEKPMRANPKSKASRAHSNGAVFTQRGPGYCLEGANKHYYCNPLNGQPPYERIGD